MNISLVTHGEAFCLMLLSPRFPTFKTRGRAAKLHNFFTTSADGLPLNMTNSNSWGLKERLVFFKPSENYPVHWESSSCSN